MENEMYEMLLKCCKPIASSEAKLLTIPFSRELEHFSAPAPSQPDEIAVLSLPESSSSRSRHVLEEQVVHTPPQDHHRSLLSDQNSRVLEAELDDEPRAKRACVAAEVIVLSDSDDEERAVDAKGRGKRVEESSKGEGKRKIGVDSRQSPVDPKIGGKRVEERAVDAKGRGRRVEESSKGEGKRKIGVDSRQSLVDPKIGGKRVEERAVDAKGRGKRVEESSKSEGKGKIGVDSRQSPVDPKIRGKRVEESREREKGGCSNDAKGSEEISPLLWLVDVLVKVFGIPPEDDDEKDIIKLAKKKGVEFLRPRWWPPPGVDDEHYPV